MHKLKVLALILLSFLFVSSAEGITKKDALNILKQFVPPQTRLKVLSVKSSPIKGLWEVVIETHGKKNIVYIDKTKRYLFLGSLIDIKKKINITQARVEDLNRVNVASIPLDDAIIYGPADAKKRVIVFEDPD